MEKKFSEFGRLILSKNSKPKGFIIFYPPATGEKGQQFIEASEFAKLNFASLLYDPSYRRMDQGGIGDLNGESALWQKAESEFKLLVSEASKHFDFTPQDLAVIGKNLGGSVASFSNDGSVRCMVVTGSVPILSNFWVHSHHPVAVENRKGFSAHQLAEFEKQTAPFDLCNTIIKKEMPILIQFGKKDPWIESSQVEFLGNQMTNGNAIKWTDDDHAMNSLESVNQRREFVLKSFE